MALSRRAFIATALAAIPVGLRFKPVNVQTVPIINEPIGGTFTLSFHGAYSEPLPHTATAEQVMKAIEGLWVEYPFKPTPEIERLRERLDSQIITVSVSG